MDNLIKYCTDKGIDKFCTFKFERKSKVVMLEHFISNKDVIKYDLYEYVHKDQFGRYKLLKYVSRKISQYFSIFEYKDIPNFYSFWMEFKGDDGILLDIKESLNKDPDRERLRKVRQRSKKLSKLKDAQ